MATRTEPFATELNVNKIIKFNLVGLTLRISATTTTGLNTHSLSRPASDPVAGGSAINQHAVAGIVVVMWWRSSS